MNISLTKGSQNPKTFKREREVEVDGNIEYTITLPEPPSYRSILNFNLPIKEQKWRIPDDIPTEYEFDNWDDDRKIGFLKREIDRRKNGVFIYINGNLEYLTGHHYFYLAYWRIDGVVPYFKDSDRDFFYIQYWTEQLKNCLGWQQVTNRRDGKTGKSTAILYNTISLKENANGGIQSKTNPDAAGIFRKLVLSWQKLPHYMKPTDSGETFPSKELKFQEPAKRSSRGDKKKYAKVLNSRINYMPSVEEAYDGSKLVFYYDDEYGKTTEVNIYDRWQIVKECLVQGRTVIGKSIHTTTAEEMETKGGDKAKQLWDESNLIEAQKIGRTMTTTGLLRWFKRASYGLEGFIDEYGYSVEEDPEKPVMGMHGELIKEGSRTWIKKEMLGLKGRALASFKRKYPMTINDAFLDEGKQSPFDVIKLNEQIGYNDTLHNLIVRGNFVWKDRENKQVVWEATESGRWNMLVLPPAEKRNARAMGRRIVEPGNQDLYVSGCDPFDHRFTSDGRKSNAASYVFRRFDPLDPDMSDTFICEYINRPPTPEMFYEDMMKQSVFYGCKLLCENNKMGLINYFRMNGFEEYLMDRPDSTHTGYSQKRQKEKGIPFSGDAVRQAAVDVTETFIYKNTGLDYDNNVYGKVFFNNLLKCWLKFNPEKWTEFDEFVGSVLCLFAARDTITKKKAVKQSFSVKTYKAKSWNVR